MLVKYVWWDLNPSSLIWKGGALPALLRGGLLVLFFLVIFLIFNYIFMLIQVTPQLLQFKTFQGIFNQSTYPSCAYKYILQCSSKCSFSLLGHLPGLNQSVSSFCSQNSPPTQLYLLRQFCASDQCRAISGLTQFISATFCFVFFFNCKLGFDWLEINIC